MIPSDLDRFRQGGFPADYPANVRTFYSPVDDVHGALLAAVESAQQSLVVAMYGYDDDQVADAIKRKLADENVQVLLTLDSSQAAGKHEREILARESYPASIVAVGRSEHGAIMHLKLLIIDGLIVVNGSTNWSQSGETLQDNQLSVVFDRSEAYMARLRVDRIHAHMLAAK